MTQLRDLARKFPADSIQKNPTGYGSYVPHHLYVQRLLMHLGAYDFELVEIVRGEAPGKAGADPLTDVVTGVVMRLSCEIDGRRTVVEEVGDCEIPSNWDTDGKRLKDAISDALKRCCARIGLGTHLYAKEPKDYVLAGVLREREEIEAGPSGGGEPSGQTLVAGNPAGESNDPTVPANLSQAPPVLSGAGDGTVSNGGTDTRSSGGAEGALALVICDECKAGDCQHCLERVDHDDQGGAPFFCDCPHDDGRPM